MVGFHGFLLALPLPREDVLHSGFRFSPAGGLCPGLAAPCRVPQRHRAAILFIPIFGGTFCFWILFVVAFFRDPLVDII